MSVARDVLFLRRPKFDYVSPPVCEALFSGSGSPIIVLDPFDVLGQITGIVIEGGGGSTRIVRWPAYPGAICYTIYLDEDGMLTVIFECVEGTEIELPDDIEGVIRITPITEDGEGPISDPVVIPPNDGGGGGDCESFIDVVGSDNVATLPHMISRINGMVIGTKNFADQRPWRYFNRVSSDIRSARASGAVTASQSANDLVDTDGANFFEAGDVGKFLQFTSGGDARQIIAFNSPTQVQVAVVDTVALSTFTVYGQTIGGAQGGADWTNGAGHIVGSENDPLGNPRIYWFNTNTNEFRDLGDLFTFLPVAINENGFVLYNNGTDAAIYNSDTQASTVIGLGLTPYDLNKNLLVVGHRIIDHFPSGNDVRAVKWQSGVMTDIQPVEAGTGIGSFSIAERLNEAGLMFGRYVEPVTGRSRTFYNNGGVSASIGFLHPGVSAPTGWIVAADLNEAGVLVGSADYNAVGPTGTSRGFKWSIATGLVQLDVLPGQPDSFAMGVNEAGIIVGQSGDRACIWLPGQLVPEDLHNYLPPASGWTLLSAQAITNGNEVIGAGILNGEFENYFLKLCL